jgi:ATP-dependent DNA ligase
VQTDASREHTGTVGSEQDARDERDERIRAADGQAKQLQPLALPTLYKRNENGSVQQWTVEASADCGLGKIVTVYGQVGGKLQRTADIVREGKNAGRATATPPVEQARAEARSKWEGKLKKGYVESLESAEAGETHAVIQGGVSPMLAHSYEKHGHKIKYPALAQPKLDGHRCIAVIQNGVCTLWSRTRKPITGVPHIARQLEAAFGGSTGPVVLDGELYNHDYRDNFEALTSLIRSQTPKPGHEAVQYWVYDHVTDFPQGDRADGLAQVGRRLAETGAAPQVVVVQTDTVDDEEEMLAVFGAYVSEFGFEGLMLRNRAGRYKNGRSYDLQKVKVMQDAEFPVLRVEEGRGRMAGLALFVVKTGEGKEFRVKMEGALEDLRKYADDPSLAVGRQLTVRFQNLSQDGIPRFPVGVRFREDV